MSVFRIVIYGDDMLQAIVPNSAKPFNFQKAYGLSDEQVSCSASEPKQFLLEEARMYLAADMTFFLKVAI